MQKLPFAGRLVIVLTLLVLGTGLFKILQDKGIFPEHFFSPSPATTLPSKPKPVQPEAKSEEKIIPKVVSQPEEKKETRPEIPVNTPSFNYVPTAPVNGTLKGVVELGASGFNSFIVRVDSSKRWKLEKAEFGNSLILENMASEEAIRTGLKRYVDNMRKSGVNGKDIHFVVSSGASKNQNLKKIINSMTALHYFVNTVSPQQEGSYALLCVLPETYIGNAFVTDIGSSSTKISWKANGKVTALETQGSKYYQNHTDDKKVYDEVAGKAKQVPASHTKTCFILGGVPFDLAKQVRKGKERYTVLKAADEYNLKDIKESAGRNIYKAVADATGCQQFVFDWDANFTIGYLLTRP